MSIKLDPSAQYRLLEHLAYSHTEKFDDSLLSPAMGVADNFLLGNIEEFPFEFVSVDLQNYFNETGDPIYKPHYIDGSHHFVACVTELSSQSSKVNVYGVYKILGMKQLISQIDKNNIEWKCLKIPNPIYKKLNSMLKIKNGVFYIPTPDYEKLSDKEKMVKEYQRIKIQKIPIRDSCCSVS